MFSRDAAPTTSLSTRSTRLRSRHLAAALVLALTLAFLPSVPEAEAAPYIPGWTFLHDDGYAHFACKTPVNSSIYGPLWKVKTLTIDGPGGNSRYNQYETMVTVMQLRRNWWGRYTIINHKNNTGWWGGLNGNTIYLSSYLRDRLWIQTNGYGPYRGSGFDPNTFARCR